MTMTTPPIYWRLQPFAELTPLTLHHIYAARQAVFIVEQSCPYQDADKHDVSSHHLCGWENESASALLAYLRILAPGSKYAEASLGRIITTAAGRGRGLGKALLEQGLKQAAQLYPGTGNRISAQHHLERFYKSFGFETVSDIYLESNIPHIEMLRAAD